jgi:hypothetical protein
LKAPGWRWRIIGYALSGASVLFGWMVAVCAHRVLDGLSFILTAGAVCCLSKSGIGALIFFYHGGAHIRASTAAGTRRNKWRSWHKRSTAPCDIPYIGSPVACGGDDRPTDSRGAAASAALNIFYAVDVSALAWWVSSYSACSGAHGNILSRCTGSISPNLPFFGGKTLKTNKEKPSG